MENRETTRKRGRWGDRTIGALVALAVGAALGTTTIAGASGDGGVIHACVKSSGSGKGNIRIVDGGTACSPSESGLQWSQAGDARLGCADELRIKAAAPDFELREGCEPPPAPTDLALGAGHGLAPGEVAPATVTLSGPAGEGGLPVVLSSSDAGVATVPASITVPAGAASAAFDVTGVAPGTAILSATASGVTRTLDVAVTSPTPARLVSFELVDDYVRAGAEVTGIVVLDRPTATATAVTLSNTDPSVATVPDSVEVPAGADRAAFSIPTSSPGQASIVATLDDAQIPLWLGVTAADEPSTLSTVREGQTELHPGDTRDYTVVLDLAAQTGGVPISLGMSDPSVATSPSQVIVPEGQKSVTFAVTAVAPGETTLTISDATGGSATAYVAVLP